MANPFTGIISSELKLLHKYMIEAVLEDDACTVPCVLTYEGSKFTPCVNCVYDVIGGKSSGRYRSGGPAPFQNGQPCPVCNSTGKVVLSSTVTKYFMPIWDSKQWIVNQPVNIAKIQVQTMSKIDTYDDIAKAAKIIIDQGISKYGTRDFVRIGDPEPLGFGASAFVLCSWGRA